MEEYARLGMPLDEIHSLISWLAVEGRERGLSDSCVESLILGDWSRDTIHEAASQVAARAEQMVRAMKDKGFSEDAADKAIYDEEWAEYSNILWEWESRA